MRFIILPIVTLLVSTSAIASRCDFTPLRFTNHVSISGSLSVTLSEPDNPAHPLAWAGPVKISLKGHPACTTSEDVGIVEEPLLLKGNTLIVPTYSGSERTLYALDTRTCRIIWKIPSLWYDPVYKDGMVIIGHQHIQFNETCHPVGLVPAGARICDGEYECGGHFH